MAKSDDADGLTVEDILDRLEEVEAHLKAIRAWAVAMQEAADE